eukprot:5747559-Alexandrium_andersonii.AAC.1
MPAAPLHVSAGARAGRVRTTVAASVAPHPPPTRRARRQVGLCSQPPLGPARAKATVAQGVPAGLQDHQHGPRARGPR